MNQSSRSEHPSIQKQHTGHNNNFNNAVAAQKTSAAPTTKTEAPVTFRASPSSYYTPTTTTTTSSYNDFVRKNSNNDFYSECPFFPSCPSTNFLSLQVTITTKFSRVPKVEISSIIVTMERKIQMTIIDLHPRQLLPQQQSDRVPEIVDVAI